MSPSFGVDTFKLQTREWPSVERIAVPLRQLLPFRNKVRDFRAAFEHCTHAWKELFSANKIDCAHAADCLPELLEAARIALEQTLDADVLPIFVEILLQFLVRWLRLQWWQRHFLPSFSRLFISRKMIRIRLEKVPTSAHCVSIDRLSDSDLVSKIFAAVQCQMKNISAVHYERRRSVCRT